MMSPSIDALFKKYLHCLIFLWFGGGTLLGCFCSQAEEPLPDGDTGALSIESKTALYSADCYITGEENEDDKEKFHRHRRILHSYVDGKTYGRY